MNAMALSQWLYLSKCFFRDGWNLFPVFDEGVLIADVPTRKDAEWVADLFTDNLAASARQLGLKKALIRTAADKIVFSIPSRMTTANNIQQNLLGADYQRLHEFLISERQLGHIVIITSNVTRDESGNPISTPNPQAGRDICHHTSDLLLPSRAYWSARQFSGYNYRLSWRAGRNDYEHLNPQYDRLKDLLARDGCVPHYEYTLYRPDGALCSYSTTYFLCRDYLGDEVRIGVSRPQDWSLLETA